LRSDDGGGRQIPETIAPGDIAPSVGAVTEIDFSVCRDS
jgi:hypothetical protein